MRTVAVALASLLVCSQGVAQAWLPQKGEGSVSLNAQSLFVKDHISSSGIKTDSSGHIRGNSTRVELTYGLTDRLTVSGDVMFVWSKYEGFKPHGPDDDRSYHGGVQDARIDFLYAMSRGRVAVTPIVRAVVPIGNYNPQGHSAIGRHLLEVATGAFVGTQFEPWAPDAYAQAAYTYSIVEHVRGVATNRSNGELELGYFVTPALSIRGLGLWQHTYGGFDLPRDFEHKGGFEIHDRVASVQYIRFGAGTTYALNRSTGVYVLFVKTYSGKNTYGSRGISAGVTWNFGGRLRTGHEN